MLPATPGYDVLADIVTSACDDGKPGSAANAPLTAYQSAVVACCGKALLALLVSRGQRFGADVAWLVSSPAFSRESPARHKEVVGALLVPALSRLQAMLDAVLVSVSTPSLP